MTEKQALNKRQMLQAKVGGRMVVAFLFFFLTMNAVAVIVIAPWIFIATTAFSLAMYVVLSLTFLIFFGVPFFEYKLIVRYIRGESNGRKAKGSCANTAGRADCAKEAGKAIDG